MVGPPAMMMIFCQDFFWKNSRPSSSGWMVSHSAARALSAMVWKMPVRVARTCPGRSRLGGYMPENRTYPPSGIIFSPYSVSPLRRDQRVRPKPTKYCVVLTPNRFPGTRCPTSCSAMEAITKAKKPMAPAR